MEIWILAILIVGLLGVFILLKNRKKELSPTKKLYYQAELSRVIGIEPKYGIIECDKILEHLLKDL